jgi:hypothetical protein
MPTYQDSRLLVTHSPTPQIIFPGLGASAQHFAIQHISNLFPGKESTIVSIFGGCWGLSSLIFTVFLRFYLSFGIQLYNLFLSYSLIAVLVFMSSSICWPMHPYTNPEKEADLTVNTEDQPLLESKTKAKLPRGLTYSLTSLNLKGNKILFFCLFKGQILSVEFLFFVPFFMIGFLYCNFYIGTVDDQLDKMGDDQSIYRNIYYWVNAFGWVICVGVCWLT